MYAHRGAHREPGNTTYEYWTETKPAAADRAGSAAAARWLRRGAHAPAGRRPRHAGPLRGRHLQAGGGRTGRTRRPEHAHRTDHRPRAGYAAAADAGRPGPERGQLPRGRPLLPPHPGHRPDQRTGARRPAGHRHASVGGRPGQAGRGSLQARRRRGRREVSEQRPGDQPAVPVGRQSADAGSARSPCRPPICRRRSRRPGPRKPRPIRNSGRSSRSRCRWNSATRT